MMMPDNKKSYQVTGSAYRAEVEVTGEFPIPDDAYTRNVLKMYLAFAIEHLKAYPDVQPAITARVKDFGKRIIKDVQTGRIHVDDVVRDVLEQRRQPN